jgi:hypothetical protein
LNGGDVLSYLLRRRIELALPSAGDEDVRPLRDEPLCGGETDAAIAPGDGRDLTCNCL